MEKRRSPDRRSERDRRRTETTGGLLRMRIMLEPLPAEPPTTEDEDEAHVDGDGDGDGDGRAADR
jgi:hypothetical protein